MKTTIIRTGDFRVDETNNKFAYAKAIANCKIFNKEAEVTFEDTYQQKEAVILKWRFMTGDDIVDSQAKFHTGFGVFKELDIEVDAEEVLAEAKAFFESLAEKIKIEKEKEQKIKRAGQYDHSFLLNELLPHLKAKGYNATPALTREEYIEKARDIALVVKIDDGQYFLGYEYHGWFKVTGSKIIGSYNETICKTTKSKKVEKMIATFEDAVDAEKNILASIEAKSKKRKGAKEQLEEILGIKVDCQTEWHSSSSRSGGYETEYFVDSKYSEDEYYNCLRFHECTKATVNGEYVKGFQISHLPVITDMEKLKQIYELLKDE